MNKFFRSCLVLIIISYASIGLVVSLVSIEWDKLSPHPRLQWRAGEEELIKDKISKVPELRIIHQRIMANAERYMVKPTNYYHKKGKRLLDVSRDAFMMLHDLSYAYRMTNEIKYAKRAEQELRAVTQFPDWNPSHFLDVGEMAMGVSIAYDWLYDQLSPETKTMVEKAILKFAFIPASPEYSPKMGKEVDNWFYGANHNWNQVCNAGLGMAAIAFYEVYPKECDKVLKRAILTMSIPLSEYAPNGAYPEGLGYWGYGTTFQAMLNSSMISALGTDFGLSDYPGFLESGYYNLYMASVSLRSFGYSDGGANSLESNSGMFFIAAKKKDPSLLYTQLKLIKLNRFTNTLLPAYLIYSKNIDFSNIQPPKQKFWSGDGKTPVVLYHSEWTDPNSKFLGIKGGCAQTSHAHLDAGSFCYESNGVRWATDLPQDSYLRIEEAGVDLWNQNDGSERWTLLRQNNKYHNTITVNGKPHLATAVIGIRKKFNSKNKKGGSLDLTSLFRGDVKKVEREIALINDHYLLITDIIEAAEVEANIQWTMVTETKPRILSEKVIQLEMNGKTAKLMIDSPSDVSWQIWDNKPEKACETPNPKTCRIGFTKDIKAKEKTYFKVRLITSE